MTTSKQSYLQVHPPCDEPSPSNFRISTHLNRPILSRAREYINYGFIQGKANRSQASREGQGGSEAEAQQGRWWQGSNGGMEGMLLCDSRDWCRRICFDARRLPKYLRSMRSRVVDMRTRLAAKMSLRRARQSLSLTPRRSRKRAKPTSLTRKRKSRRMRQKRSRRLPQARKSPRPMSGRRPTRSPTTKKTRQILRRRPRQRRPQRLRKRRRFLKRVPGEALEQRQRGTHPSRRSTLMLTMTQTRRPRRRRLRRPKLSSPR